jgi:hypothetical protein
MYRAKRETISYRAIQIITMRNEQCGMQRSKLFEYDSLHTIALSSTNLKGEIQWQNLNVSQS